MADRITRIGMVVPDPSDGCSFYRSYGPWSLIEKMSPCVELVDLTKVTWLELKRIDLLFIGRPFQPVHADVIDLARRNQVPVWIDYDDNLRAVQPDNLFYDTYSSDVVQNSITRCLQGASVITTSTKYLQNVYGAGVVIPNALDPLFKRPLDIRDRTDHKLRVLWRGSHSHTRSLVEALPELMRLTEFELIFVGETPWQVKTALLGKAQFFPTMDLVEYMEFITKMSPDVVIVPMLDNAFNRGRSNVAWIEATQAGAAVVAPGMDEFQMLGVSNYVSFSHMVERVREFASDPRQINNSYAISHDYILKNLQLHDVNKMRLQILGRMMGCSF